MTFEDLISPISTTDFFSDYFEKEILHINRANSSDFFDSILNVKDIDDFLRSGDTSNSLYGTVVDGVPQYHPYKPNDSQSVISKIPKMMDSFAHQGESIILKGLEQNVGKLGEFTQALHADLPFGFWSNIYITPPNSQAFNIHYDDHEVFILQIHGSKQWLIYDAPIELPGFNSAIIPPSEFEQKPPVNELTLTAGDTLYIPRGVAHCASSNDSSAIHITLGAGNLIRGKELLDAYVEELETDVFFRKSVIHLTESELEFYAVQLREKIHQSIDTLSLQELKEKIIQQRRYEFFGHLEKPLFTTALMIENISIKSIFKKTSYSKITLIDEDLFVVVNINYHTYKYPITMRPAFEEILQNKSLNGRRIQEIINTDENKTILLIKKWIQIGLLIIVEI